MWRMPVTMPARTSRSVVTPRGAGGGQSRLLRHELRWWRSAGIAVERLRLPRRTGAARSCAARGVLLRLDRSAAAPGLGQFGDQELQDAGARAGLGDEALYSAGGRCGTSFRLAYVNAYDDTSEGVDQPHF